MNVSHSESQDSGWEGSAHDSKVFLDAITNPNAGFSWPPKGKY